MGLQRWCQRIQPVRRPQEVLQRLCGSDVLDAERDQHGFRVYGELDFSSDLGRGVGVAAEDQDHDTRRLDRVDDGSAPLLARDNVSWRDPAPDSVRFQGGADSVGLRLVVV